MTDEDKALVKALGGWDKLMETLKKRLEEQRGRHQGGSKWIGTAGTSPFGAYGYNPEGIRIGQEGGRNRSAIKVWDERTFRNLDDSVELNTRNIKIALRRLRRFAREGVPEELDLDATIDGTAKNAGWLDLHLVPERRNRVKVLLFLDVGGSMDPHVQVCEELFSAAKSEFRHLEYFYFHNCVYDYVWRDNRRRRNERIATFDLLHKYGPDWRLVLVGDAAMSPYEIVQAGGSVEYMNDEPGHRVADADLRPLPARHLVEPRAAERAWEYTRSTQIVLEVLGPRMFPLTLDGIARGIDALRRPDCASRCAVARRHDRGGRDRRAGAWRRVCGRHHRILRLRCEPCVVRRRVRRSASRSSAYTGWPRSSALPLRSCYWARGPGSRSGWRCR